ncbi:MAG: hypothetical protein GY856_07875 [bacterium]|nr:hypothetical protein [bacterium]
MRTAVSIPDQVFEEAEGLAERLHTTRSQLYAEAVAEYITRHDPEGITERLNRVYDSIPEQEDRFVTETARSVLEHVQW